MRALALGAFGFSLMAAYCPWISGAATSPRWLVLALGAVACLILPPRRASITWAHISGMAFLAWAGLTYFWSPSPLDSIDALWKLALMACLFTVGARVDDLRPFYLGAAAGIALSSLAVIGELVGLVPHIGTGAAPAGLFVNPQYMTEAAVLVMIGLGTPRIWKDWALVGAILPAAFVYPIQRTALAALGAAAMIRAWKCNRKVAIAAALIGAAAMSGLIAIRPTTIDYRFQLWHDAAVEMTAAGAGIGSYASQAPAFSVRYDAAQNSEDHAHNDFLEIAYETGIPGLLLALAFLGAIIASPRRGEVLVVIAFAVECIFDFPLHMPATAGIFALAAGSAAGGLPVWFATAIGRRMALCDRDEVDGCTGAV